MDAACAQWAEQANRNFRKCFENSLTNVMLSDTSKQRMQEFGPPLVLAAVVSAAPYLLIYLKNLWEQAHYQFFPLLIGAVIYLAYSRWGGRYAFPSTALGKLFRWFIGVLFLGGCAGLLCATVFASPWMGYFGFACCLGVWFAHHRDVETGQSLVYLALPVALIWQPPYNSIVTGDTILIQQLQAISARLSSMWLDIFGYDHFQPGTILEIAGKSFGVAEACSGIQSFFAVLCVGALLVAFLRRGFWHSAFLLATSPFWALLMNTIRITAIPVAYKSLGIDLSHGLLHELLGYTTMALAIGLLLSTDELLLALGSLFTSSKVGHTQPAKTSPASSSTLDGEVGFKLSGIRGVMAGICMLVFLIFFGIQTYDTAESWNAQRDVIDFFRNEPLIMMSARDMPKELNGWKQVEYDQQNRERGNDDLGQRSDMWYYSAPFGRVSVSFDQMFPAWHELTRCYNSGGWTPGARRVLGKEQGFEWPAVTVEMTKGSEHGFLVFSLINRSGKPMQPPGAYNYWTILEERLRGRLTPAVRGALFGTASYQSQIFVTTNSRLPEEAQQEMIRRYAVAREILWSAASQRL